MRSSRCRADSRRRKERQMVRTLDRKRLLLKAEEGEEAEEAEEEEEADEAEEEEEAEEALDSQATKRLLP